VTESTLTRGLPRVAWRAYLELTKPRVVALMIFTVVVGMLLAVPGLPPWPAMLGGTLGIAALAGSAAAINHLVDRRLDALMSRTRLRPLPSGMLATHQALAFASMLGGCGALLLGLSTNALCTALTVGSLLGYAIVYSMFLKRRTPQNIVIGGAAGAAPPLLGWVAVTGQIDPGAIVLFTIILLWTPPHFWALAIHRREEYARAAVPMLPVTHGVAFTSRRILQYSAVVWAVSLLPWAIGMSGLPYLIGAVVLGARLVWIANRLRGDVTLAMPSFRYSIVYLFSLFALLLSDHYLMTVF
jgi:protoheme IX farnesyltransferase